MIITLRGVFYFDVNLLCVQLFSFFFYITIKILELNNAFDDDLESILLGFLYQLERVECLLKLESMRNQCTRVDLSGSHQLNGMWVASSCVSNRPLDVEGPDASCRDREHYVLSTS